MFIATGTGRCGTKSLAKILDSIEGVNTHHEYYFSLRNGNLDVQSMIAQFATPSNIVGHTGSLWLAFIPVLRLQFPSMPVVCLHRDREEVAESYMRRQHRRRAPWFLATGMVAGLTPATVRSYWLECEQRMAAIQWPVFHMDMNDLNSDERLWELCDFLGVPEDVRKFPVERRYNAGLAGMPELDDHRATCTLAGCVLCSAEAVPA